MTSADIKQTPTRSPLTQSRQPGAESCRAQKSGQHCNTFELESDTMQTRATNLCDCIPHIHAYIYALCSLGVALLEEVPVGPMSANAVMMAHSMRATRQTARDKSPCVQFHIPVAARSDNGSLLRSHCGDAAFREPQVGRKWGGLGHRGSGHLNPGTYLLAAQCSFAFVKATQRFALSTAQTINSKLSVPVPVAALTATGTQGRVVGCQNAPPPNDQSYATQ